jgi:hypothetical protein
MGELGPGEAAELATGAIDDVQDAAEGHAAAEGVDVSEPDRFGSATSVLMHTEPDISVEKAREDLGSGTAAAHAYIGVRKVLDAVTGSGGGRGMPAIANFALAAFHSMTSGDESSDPDEEAEEEDASIAELAPGGVPDV